MSYRTNSDNIYPEGSVVRSKKAPEIKLLITKYFQRTYYCDEIGVTRNKQLAYFERELLAPKPADQRK